MKTFRIATLGIALALSFAGGMFATALLMADPARAICAPDNGDCRTEPEKPTDGKDGK